MRKIFCTIVAIAAFIPLVASSGSIRTVSPESVGMSSERLQRMKEFFENRVENGGSAGYQLLVSRRGQVVMHENVGMADVADQRAINDNSLFRIFSMTKPVMAVAMMMLYEEGYFSLADPLARHIPEFADLTVYAGDNEDGSLIIEKPERPPTMLDLMQHTGGFTYGVFGDTAIDKLYREAEFAAPGKTLQDFINQLATIPLLHQPGTKWQYGVSMDIQGYLVEKWTGKTVGEFLQERLFDPLDMDETLVWAPQDKSHLLATIYSHDEFGARVARTENMPLDLTRPPTAFNGGAQLISTADDYWRFSQMLLNGGELDGVRILSPRIAAMISTNRLPESVPYRPGIGFGFNGSVVTDVAKIDYPASSGEYSWAGLATTIFWIDPREELVVIMMSQYMPPRNAEYRDVLHRLVHAAIVE